MKNVQPVTELHASRGSTVYISTKLLQENDLYELTLKLYLYMESKKKKTTLVNKK